MTYDYIMTHGDILIAGILIGGTTVTLAALWCTRGYSHTIKGLRSKIRRQSKNINRLTQRTGNQRVEIDRLFDHVEIKEQHITELGDQLSYQKSRANHLGKLMVEARQRITEALACRTPHANGTVRKMCRILEGENLITNGSFSDGDKGWVKGSDHTLDLMPYQMDYMNNLIDPAIKKASVFIGGKKVACEPAIIKGKLPKCPHCGEPTALVGGRNSNRYVHLNTEDHKRCCGKGYRYLKDGETIQKGDGFFNKYFTDWFPVHRLVGKTVDSKDNAEGVLYRRKISEPSFAEFQQACLEGIASALNIDPEKLEEPFDESGSWGPTIKGVKS